jgi:hypothetical protein
MADIDDNEPVDLHGHNFTDEERRQRRTHVVVTYNHNGQLEVLRYPSVGMAKAIFMDHNVIYQCPEDFHRGMSIAQLRALYKRMTPDKDHRTLDRLQSKHHLSCLVWVAANEYAKPFNPRSRAPKPGTKKYETRRDRIRVSLELRDATSSKNFTHSLYQRYVKLPAQAKVIIQYLMENTAEGNKYTWQQIEQLIVQAHDEDVLQTRQEPVRIFKYYKKRLVDDCLLEVLDEDEADIS